MASNFIELYRSFNVYVQYIIGIIHVVPATLGSVPVLSNSIIYTGMILAYGRRRYKVTPSLIGWAQTSNQPWIYHINKDSHRNNNTQSTHTSFDT